MSTRRFVSFCGTLATICAVTYAASPQIPPVVDDVTIHTHDPKLPNVAIVTTGGTIAEKPDPATGALVPSVTGSELIATVPGLRKLANVGVVEFSNIDSSQMTPEIWANLSKTVDHILKRHDIAGVVVTHGTDTMAEGAFFLDLTITSEKPVVFTGAMDAADPPPDGPANIENAVAQVLSPDAQDWGVTVTLNRFVNSARHVRKTQTTNLQTFESGEKGYLGYVFNNQVKRLNDRVDRIHLPLPDKLPKVPYIATYAGDDGSLVRRAVDDGAAGLVIEAVGAGNVNAHVADAIKYAISKDVAIVITTRVYYGFLRPMYGDAGGSEDLVRLGCILGADLDGPKARILLMIALGDDGNDHEKLKHLFTY